MAAPIPPNDADRQPEEPVAGAQAWGLAGGARQDPELLAQERVLGEQVAAGAGDRAEQGM
jgi:hypothetical protein